ncbi:hypothetical protein BIV57_19845 [Mangrovactinospora gilvigrisea]|uniref:Uncharacterized protein n=1 Tax=Mangrovactinospora gilvigrisea TaxID=1428644 RepID=A0A1J7C2D3_9ACTN|nr:hypothetical protein [Mangrovactinospora gilvigrisea]OIV35732.1 hypothetical protein BIV57_19845 [Mangrovactinospora gilvigrisea]
MSRSTKIVIGGAVVVLGAGFFVSWWLAFALILVPVVGYMALDKSQRRRLNRITRKELDR